MTKYICDCCGKELTKAHAYLGFTRIWYGSRVFDACSACYSLHEKLQKKALKKATKEFLKKKGCAGITEDEV